MLLRHTPKEIKPREALTVNPAKTCQPIGAMYAALGIHGCLPHSHGSQGCCAYHRSALTRHYKEPVMAGTSSFTEGASVFGGQANLLAALDTLFTVYDPEIVAVHTTCLSETIGDDLNQIIGKAKEEGKIPPGRRVIYANTPSYVGSHVTGFSNMIEGIVRGLPEKSETRSETINIIPGWVEPSDMREIKRLATEMGVPVTVFPDTSGVLDSVMTGHAAMYPKGGAPVKDIVAAGGNKHTLALGNFCSEAGAKALEVKCGVPYSALDLPIGISATDRFLQRLSEVSGKPIPESIEDERGRLVDFITDMQQYFWGKRVALWGDPDQLVTLSEFLVDIDMRPVYVVSGTPGKSFDARIAKVLGSVPEAKFKNGAGADMFLMHQWIKNEKVDLLLGNTYGKYIARDEGIPFVRVGFPIFDRVGHSYMPLVGYAGAIRLLERILNAILDHKDATCPEYQMELVE